MMNSIDRGLVLVDKKGGWQMVWCGARPRVMKNQEQYWSWLVLVDKKGGLVG